MIKKTFLLMLLSIISLSTFAQDNQAVEMSGLYQSGKIYVVVVVLAVIFLGIIAYLIKLDRKISKLEKEIKK